MTNKSAKRASKDSTRMRFYAWISLYSVYSDHGKLIKSAYKDYILNTEIYPKIGKLNLVKSSIIWGEHILISPSGYYFLVAVR